MTAETMLTTMMTRLQETVVVTVISDKAANEMENVKQLVPITAVGDTTQIRLLPVRQTAAVVGWSVLIWPVN